MRGVILLAILLSFVIVACGREDKIPTSTATVAIQEEASPVTATDTPGAVVEPTTRPKSTYTVTSEPTATLEPSNTSRLAEPHPDAPECPVHDPNRYHELWNDKEGCHYDHTHNADSAEVENQELREVVETWGISYPWQTPNENQIKHQGYKNAHVLTHTCELFNGPQDSNCVLEAFIQTHATGSALGLSTRYHSFRAGLYICNQDETICGNVRTGGWGDWGILHCDYKRDWCLLPGDPPGHGENAFRLPPYRSAPDVEKSDDLSRHLNNGQLTQQWNSGQGGADQYYPDPFNVFMEFDFTSVDGWGGVYKSEPGKLHLICEDGSCKYNHSTLRVYDIRVRITHEFDEDGDGIADFSGFTDRRGNVDSNCTEVGIDCVPLEISNVPVGTARFEVQSSSTIVGLDQWPDFDICFDGDLHAEQSSAVDCRYAGEPSGWIKYPN